MCKVNSIRLLFTIICLGLLVFGCGGIESAIDSGHYAKGAIEFEKTGKDYYAQEPATHFGLCEAYLRAKKFDAFFDCYKLYEKRIAENEGKHKPRIVYGFNFNAPYGKALAREKLARAYLALGDNAKALETASKALAVTEKINEPVIDGWVHWSIEEVLM